MQDKLSQNATKESRDKEAVKSCVRAFYRFPKLVYVPYVWTKTDQEMWKAMNHVGKCLIIICLRENIEDADVRCGERSKTCSISTAVSRN